MNLSNTYSFNMFLINNFLYLIFYVVLILANKSEKKKRNKILANSSVTFILDIQNNSSIKIRFFNYLQENEGKKLCLSPSYLFHDTKHKIDIETFVLSKFQLPNKKKSSLLSNNPLDGCGIIENSCLTQNFYVVRVVKILQQNIGLTLLERDMKVQRILLYSTSNHITKC